MDEAVYTWAITAVDHQGDKSDAEKWFAAIRKSYLEPAEAADYAEFSARLLKSGVDAGVSESDVKTFLEDLAKSTSTPMDVVEELSEKYDSLAAKYVELAAVDDEDEQEDEEEDEATDEAAEALWNWDEEGEEWSHFEDGEWVPQRSWDGTNWLLLNKDKNDWVIQRTYDGAQWWVMNEDRSEWVLEPGQDLAQDVAQDAEEVPIEVEPAPAGVAAVESEPEPVPPGQVQQPAVELVPAAEAVVATEVMAASLDEAMLELPGIEDLSEDEIRAAMERALASELKVS